MLSGDFLLSAICILFRTCPSAEQSAKGLRSTGNCCCSFSSHGGDSNPFVLSLRLNPSDAHAAAEFNCLFVIMYVSLSRDFAYIHTFICIAALMCNPIIRGACERVCLFLHQLRVANCSLIIALLPTLRQSSLLVNCIHVQNTHTLPNLLIVT